MMKHGRIKEQLGEDRVVFVFVVVVFALLLAYTSISLFIIEGSQDRNSNREGTWSLEAGADPEALEG